MNINFKERANFSTLKNLEKITPKSLTDTKCVVILSIIYTEVNYTLSIGCEQE